MALEDIGKPDDLGGYLDVWVCLGLDLALGLDSD